MDKKEQKTRSFESDVTQVRKNGHSEGALAPSESPFKKEIATPVCALVRNDR